MGTLEVAFDLRGHGRTMAHPVETREALRRHRRRRTVRWGCDKWCIFGDAWKEIKGIEVPGSYGWAIEDSGDIPPPEENTQGVELTVTTWRSGDDNTWVIWNSTADVGGVAYCQVRFSTGQPGFDMAPDGGPQNWTTGAGDATITCFGNLGGRGSATAQTW